MSIKAESRDFAHGTTFIMGARDMGIETLSAVYELIDNSLDADAENIHIHVEDIEEDGEEFVRIYVEDDGRGITETIDDDGTTYDGITYVLAFGDRYNQGAAQIGKFGWGLSASATCTSVRTEVYTKQEDETDWRYTYLDLEEMESTNNTTPPLSKKKAPDHLDLANPVPDSGTIVSFEKCDNTNPKTARGIEGQLIKNIPRVYRNYLDGDISITVNGTNLEPIDPLFMMENARNVGELPEKVPLVEDPYLSKTIHLEEKKGDKKYPVKLTVVQLDVEAIRTSDAYSRTWMSDHNLTEANQGFSIVRNGREIRNGLTLGIFKRHASKNFMRAEIEFPPELDERFGIQTDKSRLSLKQSVKDKIENGLENSPNQIARKTEKIRKKVIAEEQKAEGDAEPSPSERAAEKAAKFMKKPRNQTDEEREEIVEQVEQEKKETIEKIKEDPELDKQQKEEQIEQEEKKYERQKNENSHNVTTATLGTGHFYEAEFQGNQVNAIINDGHRFYEVYEQLRTGGYRDPDAVSTDGGVEQEMGTQTEESVLIDHMLLAAARAELMMQDRFGEDALEYIYQFRSEWSEFLRSFIKYMDDGIEEAAPNLRN
ncbi:ATP-binding protein [Haladaptatus sp. T7]|uniref:ATP-binding protein n=1 Tax=Haladaptatus sp. T7 TaxID=2029368 RepID=UPI0021A25428|nr:ATP-binding protein [Haladaptatus sp. T7]GKZ16066.1 hypothetical protein HAL_39470 [Haladaptatus sp. T7]